MLYILKEYNMSFISQKNILKKTKGDEFLSNICNSFGIQYLQITEFAWGKP